MPIPAPQGQPQQPQAAPTPTPGDLPPPISSVASGALPAIRFPAEGRESSSPLSSFVSQNLDGIARAGVAFTELPDKQSVLFNATKTSKAAIHKLYAEKKLDQIPEIKAVPKPPTSLAGRSRTIHSAPTSVPPAPASTASDASAGGPATGTVASPTNSANAPAGPAAAPVDPDAGHVKVDKKLLSQRVQALQKSGEREGGLPATVLSRLSKRAI